MKKLYMYMLYGRAQKHRVTIKALVLWASREYPCVVFSLFHVLQGESQLKYCSIICLVFSSHNVLSITVYPHLVFFPDCFMSLIMQSSHLSWRLPFFSSWCFVCFAIFAKFPVGILSTRPAQRILVLSPRLLLSGFSLRFLS